MSDTTHATVPLREPINVDGETIASLTMRRPKVKDSRWAQTVKGTDFDRGVALMARLCKTEIGTPCSPEHIDELDEADAAKLQDLLNSFREAS